MSDSSTVHKGVWAPDGPVDLVGANLFDAAISWPVMVLRRSAVEANIAAMADYCARHGVQLAPHGKTTMVPELFRAQLDAGAWGITVATPHQALLARRFGVGRVLLANEVVDPAVLRWAARESADGWEFICYVDSDEGVAVLRDAMAQVPGRVGVFIEMGYTGGRTGCRDVASATRLASAVSTVDGVEVLGVAGFEGLLERRAEVRAFLDTLVAAATAIAPVARSPLVISAGGSRFFDDVVATFSPPAREHGWTVLLRSGCYLSHDHGFYATNSPFTRDPAQGSLQPALEAWAQVLSTPEPGLALIGAGKRDLPSDLGLPVALAVRGRDGTERAVSTVELSALNDQHGYLRGVDVRPGELVRLGISHPCTAFDRWPAIPVVDDDYRVVDLYHTYF
jgi:D-serine deaminase-like pyridoxal phosphate-dependent protein